MSQDNTFPILAAIGFNDGANKGFWRVQPREQFGDGAGQWIEMGAELRMFFKNQRGETANVTGRAVGSTGTPDGVRVLVQGQSEKGVPDGIYGAKTSSVRVAEGFIPDEVLKEQGIENTVKISKEQEAALPTIDSLERADITDEDMRLINEGSNSKEAKEHAEYKKSVESAEGNALGESVDEREIPNFDETPSAEEVAERLRNQKAPEGTPAEDIRDGFISNKPELRDEMRGDSEAYFGFSDIPYDDEQWGRGGGEYPWPNMFDVPKPTRDLTNVDPKDQTDFEIAHHLSGADIEFTDDGKRVGGVSEERYKALDAEARKRIAARLEDDPARYNFDSNNRLVEKPFEDMSDPVMELEKKVLGSDGEESAVKEALAQAQTGGEIPNLNNLINFAKAPPKTPIKNNQTKKRFAEELEPGMVIRDKSGKDFVVQDAAKRVGATKDGIQVASFNVIPVGKKDVRTVRVDAFEALNVVVGPDDSTPIKMNTVAPQVAKPATPTTPTKPTTPKPPTTRKARVSQLLKKYKDDGKDIAPAAKSREELYNKVIRNEIDPETGELLFVADKNGNPRPINAPNAVEDAIFEENPNAKVQPNGAIVAERGKFTDTDGKEYDYEIRVERTKGNQFMERYTFSDPETKEVLFDFYNHDYKETFNSLYGKSNGLVVTRDFFLGKTVPGKEGVDAEGVPNNKELQSYFGPSKTIANRIKYLLKSYGAKREPRIITPENNRKRFLDGHGIVYNKSDTRTGRDGKNSTLGTVARSFVPNIYELVESKDVELIKEAFKQAMGRLPDTDEDITALIKTLQEGIREKFAGTPDYASIVQLPRLMAARLLEDNADIRDDLKVPFVSQDGVTQLEPGSYVQFFNNEDGISVGRVTRLIAGSGKGGNYKDTVAVKFADKTVANLQTRNMKPLTDDELDLTVIDNDNLLTPYVPQLEGEEMREVRLGIDYRDALNRKDDSPDDNPDDILDSGDAGGPYLGSDGEEGDELDGPGGGGIPVEELTSGDSLYSADGEFLGTVVDVQQVPSTDGGAPGFAVTYLTPEGEEDVDVLDAGEIRSPK